MVQNNQVADLLKAAQDPDITSQFRNPNTEVIMLSCRVDKWNSFVWK